MYKKQKIERMIEIELHTQNLLSAFMKNLKICNSINY